MKIFVTILATAIVSVGLTVVVVHRKATRDGTVATGSTVPASKASQAWLDLKTQSAKLDAQLRETSQTDAKNSAEASRKLKIYRDYCNAEIDLFSKEEAVYRNEHDSEDSPVLIEQGEATAAWCDSNEAIFSFMADPRNAYSVSGDELSTNDATTYNRLLLAFRVASVRLVNANGAEASQERQ